jgi:cell division protein ZapA
MGYEYVLRTQVEENQVRRVASYLNERLSQIQDTANPTSALAAVVLAALNITNDYLQLKDCQNNMLREIEAQTEKMLVQIEQQEG